MVDLLKTIFGLRKTTGNWYFDNLDQDVVTGLVCKIRGLSQAVDLEQPLDKTRMVVFDLETTGFHPFAGDEIIAVGAVVIEHGKIDLNQAFNRLVNPYRAISQETTALTGITNQILLDKEGVFEVLQNFLDFIGDSILVAHNADFDLNFINIKLRRHCQTKLTNPIIDTVVASQLANLPLKNHTLDNLVNHFRIPPLGRHTALGDSIITAQLLIKLIPLLKKQKISTLRNYNDYKNLRFY